MIQTHVNPLPLKMQKLEINTEGFIFAESIRSQLYYGVDKTTDQVSLKYIKLKATSWNCALHVQQLTRKFTEKLSHEQKAIQSKSKKVKVKK